MNVSIRIKDAIDGCVLELESVDDQEEVLLIFHDIHASSDLEDKPCIQVKIEEIKLALRKLTAK